MAKSHLGEAEIQRRVMVDVSKEGTRIFRNNVGDALFEIPGTDKKRRVKYGLHPGSSDLIGWTPRVITAEDVGKTVAVFTALEVKRPGKNPTESQERFLDAVRAGGGIGAIVRSAVEAVEVIRRWR